MKEQGHGGLEAFIGGFSAFFVSAHVTTELTSTIVEKVAPPYLCLQLYQAFERLPYAKEIVNFVKLYLD